MRGLPLAGLCNELGLSIKKLISMDGSQLETVVDIFGLDPTALEDLWSWTPQPVPGLQVRFRGELFGSRAVISPVMRGCPACLRDDLQCDRTPPQGQMVMRGEWQLRYSEICLRHRQPLVALWTVTAPLARYDFPTRLREIADDIVQGRLDRPTQAITGYDRWLDDRLSSGADLTWLASHPTDTAARFCQLLGAELIRVMPGAADDGLTARGVGFDCASRGPAAITAALTDLADKVDWTQYSAQKAFGRLYQWLSNDMAGDARCDPYRNLLRNVILETWAIPAGETVLGQSLAAPRLHSVLTAAKEIGRSPKVARQFLEHAGIVDPADRRPDARLTFDAAAAQSVLAQARRLVIARDMRRRLGASLGQFHALVRADVVCPVLPLAVSKLQWDTDDADALLRKLLSGAVTIHPADSDWVPIGVAAGLARVDIKTAVDAACSGLILTGILADAHGYGAVHVRQRDMDELREGEVVHVTLAEFARQVGLHNNGNMTALHAAGHVTTIGVFNPATRRMGLYVTNDGQAAFPRPVHDGQTAGAAGWGGRPRRRPKAARCRHRTFCPGRCGFRPGISPVRTHPTPWSEAPFAAHPAPGSAFNLGQGPRRPNDLMPSGSR
ncbi:TniQ protein [Loktanella sp. DSM 29012]|nr:TniQ protein [Loktanella sp. DSM 29012]